MRRCKYDYKSLLARSAILGNEGLFVLGDKMKNSKITESESIIFSQVKRHSNELIKFVDGDETIYRIKTNLPNGEIFYLRISCTSNHLATLKLLVTEYQKRGI